MRLAAVEEPVSSLQEDIRKAFQAHHALVLRTAWRVTGNATDAEDVLQTVFLRLLRRDASQPPLDNIEAYLRRAAVNAALDVVRARREHVPAEAIASDEPEASKPAGANGQDLHEVLRQALAAFPSQVAEILTLRFLEGYSNSEIAKMLRISAVKVAVVVHRGRGRLQKELRRYQGVRR
jgi:RNA polymerase sigma-70 factor, ECF subfamily